MVVISVIGVLMSLLLPSLRNAREASLKSVCTSNLKQVFIAETNYISGNSGRITPATYTNGRSYDDLLSGYMGRDMSEFKQNKINFLKMMHSTHH